MKKFGKALPACAAFGLLLCLVLFSAEAKAAAADALSLCAATLVPTLFPFYAAVNLLLNMGALPSGKITQMLTERCFRLPGEAASAVLLGLLGGYPVGISVTAALYRQGLLTRDEAVRLSMFANNAGPGFILGAAGLSVFHSVPLGLLLLGIHTLSAFAAGFAVRTAKKPNPVVRRSAPHRTAVSAPILPKAISDALQSMLMICAYVVFCSVCLAMIRALPLFGMLAKELSAVLPAAEAFFCGLCELSCGILALRGLPTATAFATASVLLGWGGLCVFLQSAAVLRAAGLPARQCLIGKALQAAFSGLLSCAVCGIVFHQRPSVAFFAIPIIGFFALRKIRGRKNRYSLI